MHENQKKKSWEEGMRCWRGGCSCIQSFSNSIFIQRVFQSLFIHPLCSLSFSLSIALSLGYWLHTEFLHKSASQLVTRLLRQSLWEATVALYTFSRCVREAVLYMCTRVIITVHFEYVRASVTLIKHPLGQSESVRHASSMFKLLRHSRLHFVLRVKWSQTLSVFKSWILYQSSFVFEKVLNGQQYS